MDARPGTWRGRAAGWAVAVMATAAWLGAAPAARGESYRGEMNSWSTTWMSQMWNSDWEVTVTAPGDDSTSEFKFDQDGDWDPQWGAGSSITKNSGVGTLTAGSGSGNLNFGAAVNGKRYTFRMNTAHTKYTVSETSGDPVSVSSVSHDYAATNSLEGPTTVTIGLSGSKSSEEGVWVRYTTDAWSSSILAGEATGSGTAYAAVIPALADGTQVQLYVLTSTYPSNVLASADVDLATLRGNNNGGQNYSFRVFAPKQKRYADWTNAVTAYLGDTNVRFYADTYQQAGTVNARSQAQIVMRAGNADLTTGSTVAGTARDPGAAADATYADAGQFTATGTWYWGMKVSYGTGTNFWVVSSNDTWTLMAAQPTNASLAVTVGSLGDPSGPSAETNAVDPDTKADLAWSVWNSRRVMVVRRLGDSVAWSPEQGTSYSNGQDLGDDTVVLIGSTNGTAWTDSGLTPEATYYYKFYTENSGYYSSGAEVSVTLEASPGPELTRGPVALSFATDLGGCRRRKPLPSRTRAAVCWRTPIPSATAPIPVG